jgi:hypothetical protein
VACPAAQTPLYVRPPPPGPPSWSRFGTAPTPPQGIDSPDIFVCDQSETAIPRPGRSRRSRRLRSLRLSVRTPPFHGGESGSIPLGSANPAGRTVNGSTNLTNCGSIAVPAEHDARGGTAIAGRHAVQIERAAWLWRPLFSATLITGAAPAPVWTTGPDKARSTPAAPTAASRFMNRREVFGCVRKRAARSSYGIG